MSDRELVNERVVTIVEEEKDESPCDIRARDLDWQ